jgi:hypothetical protein
MCSVVAFALLITSAGRAASVSGDSSPMLTASVQGATSIDASGQGCVAVKVHVTGADGQFYPKGTPLRALIVRGDARLANGLSSDLTTDAGSNVTLPVYPGTQAGPLVVRLEAGDAVAEVPLMLTAAIRKPLVVGYATGGIGPVPGWIEAADNAPDGNNARRGAISVFGTGQIARNTRGTFAYDSANTLEQTLAADPFLDNPNDRPFPTYGDTSVRHDDALSTNHIFGSVQNGYSSAMWGQFYATAAPSTAVGGYDVLVNGARVQGGGNVLGASAFTARNDIAYARAVISPTGLAIASQALAPDIVIGSDVLTLVHLDRRTGAILSETQLGRGTDYVIDYATGLLRFLNIILPYDDNFNPQVVVVQYEYGGPGAVSTMLGGNATAHLGAHGRADAWYLNDADGSGNLTLLGESLAGGAPGTSWSVSHERSSGFLPITTNDYGASGDAYKASLALKSRSFHLALDFADTDAAYDNPFGNYTAPGLESLNVVAGFVLGPKSELDLSYMFARNDLPASIESQAIDNSDQQAAIVLRVKPTPRFSYHIGIENDVASSNGVVSPLSLDAGTTQTPNVPGTFGNFLPQFDAVDYVAGSGHSLDAVVGGSWRFAPRSTIAVTRDQPLGAATDPYDPPSTQAEFDQAVGTSGTFFVRQLWQQSESQVLSATQSGAAFAGTAQSQTSVGFEQQVGPTTYQSGYAVDHTANGTDLFDAIGVRTKLITGPRLNADGFIQVGNSLYSTYGSADQNPFFIALGTSLSYSLKSFHATGQVQERTGYDSGSSFQLGATGPISPAVSLFGSYTGSYTENVFDTEGRGGLAYRPSRNDRYVTLVSYDVYRSNLTNYDAYTTNVAQVQELYRSSSRTEFAASAAYKLTGDDFFAPHTTIFGLRGDQRIGGRFDLGSEVHWSDVAPVSGTNATGFAVEAGYRLGSTLRLAAGYNFQGFADPETAVNPTHRGLYVTMSTYIDRIFGWGKDDR